ncbi:MAG: hypothetical protein ACKO34_08345 [Vampirovibrionales bacterium]
MILWPELRSSEGQSGVKGQRPLHAGGSLRGTLVQESPLSTRQLEAKALKKLAPCSGRVASV